MEKKKRRRREGGEKKREIIYCIAVAFVFQEKVVLLSFQIKESNKRTRTNVCLLWHFIVFHYT
jgi:hypothetical protein